MACESGTPLLRGKGSSRPTEATDRRGTVSWHHAGINPIRDEDTSSEFELCRMTKNHERSSLREPQREESEGREGHLTSHPIPKGLPKPSFAVRPKLSFWVSQRVAIQKVGVSGRVGGATCRERHGQTRPNPTIRHRPAVGL